MHRENPPKGDKERIGAEVKGQGVESHIHQSIIPLPSSGFAKCLNYYAKEEVIDLKWYVRKDCNVTFRFAKLSQNGNTLHE